MVQSPLAFKHILTEEHVHSTCFLLQQNLRGAVGQATHSGQRAQWALHCGVATLQTQISSGSAAIQGEEAIEDWEIWGDPREIERRKAERARAAIPPEQRKLQVQLAFLHGEGCFCHGIR